MREEQYNQMADALRKHPGNAWAYAGAKPCDHVTYDGSISYASFVFAFFRKI